MYEDFRKKRNNYENRMYDKKALPVRRVAKVTKGGKRLRFSTVVVVGDRKGSVGVALGRGADVKSAVEQGERLATKVIKKIELIWSCKSVVKTCKAWYRSNSWVICKNSIRVGRYR